MLHADEVYTPGRKLKVVLFLHGTVYSNVSSEDEILNLSHFSMPHHMGHSTALMPTGSIHSTNERFCHPTLI